MRISILNHLILLACLILPFQISAQTVHAVCVAEAYAAGSCSNNLGVFTPASINIATGDQIQFTTRMELLGGYNGTHDIRFTGSAANNVLLTISTNILAPWTTVTTPAFNTPGTFAMECVNGNHCVVAVYLSNWNCTGYSVTVSGAPPCNVTAAFTTSADTICLGDTLFLNNSSSNATTYSWEENGSPFSTNTNTNRTFSAIGTYTFSLVASDGGCSDSVSQAVLVLQGPSVTANANPATICLGDTIQLTGTGANQYNWTGAGLLNSSGANVQAVPQSSMNYSLLGTDNNGCQGSAMIPVTVNALPQLSISANPDTICAGDTLQLTGLGANQYAWTGPALLGNTGSVVNAVPSTSTSYQLTGTDINGCADVANHSVTVNPLPAVPTITFSGPTIVSSAAIGNQWYLNGNAIAGANLQSHTPLQSGTYSVFLTDANGCSVWSDTLYVNLLGLSSSAGPLMTVFPNPGTGIFRVQASMNEMGPADLHVQNSLGQIVYEMPMQVLGGGLYWVCDLSRLPQGLYFFEVRTDHSRAVRRVVLQ